MNLLLPSGESLLQIIIVPRLKSPPAIPEVGFEMLNRFENLQTFLHKTTATACQLHQQEGCRSALGLPVKNDSLANGTYMDY